MQATLLLPNNNIYDKNTTNEMNYTKWTTKCIALAWWVDIVIEGSVGDKW